MPLTNVVEMPSLECPVGLDHIEGRRDSQVFSELSVRNGPPCLSPVNLLESEVKAPEPLLEEVF